MSSEAKPIESQAVTPATAASKPQQQQRQPKQPKQPRQPKADAAASAEQANAAVDPAAAAAGATPAPHHHQHHPHHHHHAHQHQRVKQPKQPKQPAPAKEQNGAASSSAAAAPAASSSSLPSVLLHPSFPSVHLVDIGANLLDDMFSGNYHGAQKHPADLSAVLVRARQRGVGRIIVTAGTAQEGEDVLQLVNKLEAQAKAEGVEYPLLYSTVGVHPSRSREWDGDEAFQQKYFDSLLDCIMRGLGPDAAPQAAAAASASSSSSGASAAVAAHSHAHAAHHGHSHGHSHGHHAGPAARPSRQVVVAIGECGLDYDRLHYSGQASQLRHFAKHFDLVEKVATLTAGRPQGPLHLPLFLHDRNTRGDFLAIIKANRSRFKHGVVHSFTGTIEDLQQLLALDLYIGINGCSLKTDANLAALDLVPLNRLMLETDAPWCDIRATHASAALVSSKFNQASRPEKWSADLQGVRGRNEPGSMVQVLEVVAARLGHDPIELADIVWENTKRVFFPDELKQPQA